MNQDSQFIWMDGKLTPYADAKISVLSHSLHYGTGAFEGMRAYATQDGKTALFRGPEHLKRLIDSVHSLGLEIEYSVPSLMDGVRETIRANQFKECYVRPIAYLDDSVRGLFLPGTPKVQVAIATWPWGKYMGDKGHTQGVAIIVSTYRRAEVASSLPHAKITGSYITSVLARKEAVQAGVDEALMLDSNGYVAEGSGENLFLIRGNQIFTPLPLAILPGITRHSVMQIARDLGYTLTETPITRNELYLADELFFTGTAVEVTPITSVDRRKIASGKPGPITQKIADTFFKTVRGEIAQYKNWLTTI